jgi:acetyl-CoA carboxylase biotin carboxyl carrier protein
MQSRKADDIQYTLSYQDVVEVLRLVRESQSLASFALEVGEMKLHVVRCGGGEAGAQAVPAAPAATLAMTAPVTVAAAQPVSVAAAPVVPAVVTDDETGTVAVRAPLLGIFYRRPSPEAPAFVEEGDVVGVDDTVALIEVMKLFSTVTAGVRGRVVKILAENAAMVEHGQTLMLIEPLRE